MLLGMGHSRFWLAVAAGIALSALVAPSLLRGRSEPSVEELKERVANAVCRRSPRAVHPNI